MTEEVLNKRHQIQTYLTQAHRSLEAAALNLDHGFYATVINRAYYAVFYAASSLLLVKDISRSKHSGVIAAYRQHFVRPGLIESEYSDIYGDVMEARIDSDYDMTSDADPETAKRELNAARRFVKRTSRYLREEGWL
jgi:uncharacterized protein (UPF0332 family)